ncbi:uncharacterized protein LOC116338763 [Contarinia nasturtii]|uniref:uncharacterized protein LOC116338763 n=1 Tax=Contarinia nasturtii TaxID=265458 RepID=UPI0012D42D97|nr:uncharacterized protein LOC116338763 [Contarinia nasturtii]
MSTRRPRVKAAVIFKPRRPQASANEKPIVTESNVEQKPLSGSSSQSSSVEPNNSNRDIEENESIVFETKPDVKPSLISEKTSENASPSHHVNKANQSHALDDVVDSLENKPPDASPSKVVSKPSPNLNAASTPFRRISAPPVNIVNRRKSLIAANDNNRTPSYGSSPKYMKSPSYSFVRDPMSAPKEPKSSANQSPLHPHSAKPSNNIDDEIFSPAPVENDECFKSPPFMSPIYTRRIDPSMSPFHDIYGDDFTKSPSSQMPNNTKIRQRIRPTPCFLASRRNSIQGSSGLGGASESEDEQNRRQRHYSTSSNHSSYNPSTTPQHQRNYFGLNKVPSRVRTESYSSTISDHIPFSKSKRSHRSEEYQRVANAKREFNQRLNGKPPDKSRLTMYDLIYYNPLTNPMSKPAGKGDKNGDNASVSSAKTSQSKSSGSVKSESSTGLGVKTEMGENTDGVTGPVPQLKLDANGEIILDEKSLVIETTGDKEAREILANSDVVYDDEFSGTSGFYKRQKRTRDWLPLETLKFYKSLQTIGTDFSCMLQLFPNRSRRDLKLKFKKEEKHNMALINKALMHPKEFNVDELKLQFDKEDYEIEQKKQEWAELRKKMTTERKVQINASRRRNPNRQISRSMRNLTDGDAIYENEFVALPPKSKKPNRKRKSTPELIDDAVLKNVPNVYDPLTLNHNNNHVENVDSLPHHTYATHKLPSFTEMISSRKTSEVQPNSSHESNSDTTPIVVTTDKEDRVSNLAVESNGTYAADEDSVHAIDLSMNSSSLVIHSENNSHENDAIDEHIANGDDDVPVVVENASIDQYIAKNPNLTYKGSGDIMNMDIIFENVSIEEDVTIGTTSVTNVASTDAPKVTETDETSNNMVKIDGIQYEIITLENSDKATCDEAKKDIDQLTSDKMEHLQTSEIVEEVVEDMVEVSTMGLIGEESYDDGGNYMYNSNEVVIMACSNLGDGVEIDGVETIEEITESSEIIVEHELPGDQSTDQTTVIVDECDNKSSIIVPLSNVDSTISTEENDTKSPNNHTIKVLKEETEQQSVATVKPIENKSATERKRRPKVVPVLANNKRSKRPSPNSTKMIDTIKIESVPSSEIQSDSRIIEQPSNLDPQQIEQTVHNDNEEQTTSNDQLDNHIQNTETDTENDNDADNQERNVMDSLVVVESQDPNDPSRTIHEVYVIDPETNEISDKPLDLEPHVIDSIRLSLSMA